MSNIFRQKALDRLNSPQNLEEYVRVTSPSVYLVLAALLLLAAGLVLWAFFGTVTDKVKTQGVIFPVEEAVEVNLPYAGTVRAVYVHRGDYVQQNQDVAIVSIGEAYSTVTAPASGTVLGYKSENEKFDAYESLMNLIPGNGSQTSSAQNNHIISFVDFKTQRSLREGMEVQVSPKDLPREKYGYISGEVVRVAQYPVDRQEVKKRLQIEELVNDILSDQGSQFEVEIVLNTLEGHPDKYDWSFASEEGEAQDIFDQDRSFDINKSLGVGSFCDLQIVTRKTSVMNYIFDGIAQKIRNVKQITK